METTGIMLIIAAVFAVAAVVLFVLQRRKHSEALAVLCGVCAGAALCLVIMSLCVGAIFVRPLYD